MALFKTGKTVLKPFGYNQRYDVVIEENGVFKRVQCKTGRLRDGVVRFNAYSINKETRKRVSYKGQIEYFGVYCPELDKTYLVPIEDADVVGDVYLRVEPPKAVTGKVHKFASQYELK